jgi:hypothetical protein
MALLRHIRRPAQFPTFTRIRDVSRIAPPSTGTPPRTRGNRQLQFHDALHSLTHCAA